MKTSTGIIKLVKLCLYFSSCCLAGCTTIISTPTSTPHAPLPIAESHTPTFLLPTFTLSPAATLTNTSTATPSQTRAPASTQTPTPMPSPSGVLKNLEIINNTAQEARVLLESMPQVGKGYNFTLKAGEDIRVKIAFGGYLLTTWTCSDAVNSTPLIMTKDIRITFSPCGAEK